MIPFPTFAFRNGAPAALVATRDPLRPKPECRQRAAAVPGTLFIAKRVFAIPDAKRSPRKYNTWIGDSADENLDLAALISVLRLAMPAKGTVGQARQWDPTGRPPVALGARPLRVHIGAPKKLAR